MTDEVQPSKADILTGAIAQRQQEITLYDINIDNYTRAVADIAATYTGDDAPWQCARSTTNSPRCSEPSRSSERSRRLFCVPCRRNSRRSLPRPEAAARGRYRAATPSAPQPPFPRTTMKTSARGVAFIAAREGIVTRAYRDVAGVWTIGVGHTAAAGPPTPVGGMTMTRDEALAILARDLATCEPRVAARLATDSQTVFDGGVSFDFNTGAIDRASWVAALRDGNTEDARAKLMLWTKAGGRDIAGLVKRRAAEARLIFDGDYGATDSQLPSALSPDATLAVQGDLATLGFYHGPVDGIAGDAVRAAVIAYQESHPDLVADGIAGAATQACIARDLAARRTVGASAGSGAVVAAAGGAVAMHAHAAHPWIIAAAIAGAVLAIGAAILAHRWGGEIKRAITPTAKDG